MSIRAQRHLTMAALLLAGAALCCSPPAPKTTDQPAAPGDADPNAGIAAADAEITAWIDAERVPGAVLLVSRAGEPIFEQAYGHAWLYAYGAGEYGAAATDPARPDALQRLDEPVPMRTDTLFDLASVTKVMATTFAVMLLVEEGAVEVDAPVSRYLPDFGDDTARDAATKRAATMEEPAANNPLAARAADAAAKSAITIRQLLTHRAGLSQWQPIYYSAADAAGAYAFIRDFPLTWEPGRERRYSDLGFMLLGVLVEEISGQSLGEFLERRLYAPLGLSAIGFRGDTGSASTITPNAGGPAAPDPARRSAGPPDGRFAATSHGNPFEHRMVHDPDFGYRIDIDPDSWDGWRRYTLVGEVNDGNAFHAFGGEAGHAGLFSTAADLQVLLQLLLNGGEYGGRSYLSTGTVDEFLADTGDRQALGWQVPDYLPDGSFAHTGFTGTYVAGIPSGNITIVLLTNRQNIGVDTDGRYPDLGELQRAVARALAAADSR